MGNIVACIGAGLGWCCCTATGSLVNSCCGNDKPSTIPPSIHSGRKRSVALLIFSIALSFVYQYWVGPALKPSHKGGLNPVLSYLSEAWDCEEYSMGYDEDGYDDTLRQKCSGNHGVFRIASFTLLFYILAGIAAYCKPTANREAWPAKFILYSLFAAATIFIPNEPLFTPIFINVFRIGGILFIIFDQLIILDLAYNLNESWVEKANKAELDEGPDAGKKWLGALLLSCAVLIIGSLTAIILMYVYFSGCATNEAFITVTLIAGVGLTIIQLMGEESSLFTSSSIFAYSTYLCYTAVSKNPNNECNPLLGEESNVSGIILGLIVTLITVTWISYSRTAHRAVGENSDAIPDEEEETSNNANENTPITGNVINRDENEDGQDENEEHQTFASSWKLNMILAFVCCWYAMVLTSWGTVADAGNIANTTVGETSMWIIICSQWFQNLLYFWTLIASKMCPNRDFS